MKQTLTAGLLLLTVGIATALAVESPYLPLAATGDAVVLVEKERVGLEREFKALLEANGKSKYLEQYAVLEPKAKDKIASSYRILQTKGLEDKKTAAATAALIESGLGVQNAKTIIREWTKNKKDANLETYTVAQKIRAVAKLAPEILEFYDIAELEEIDRLQIEVLQAQTAAIEQRSADADKRSADADKRSADADKRSAANRKEIERLHAVIKRLGALLDKN